MDKIVPDTSVIINRLLTKLLISGEIKPKEVIIPNAVISELQHQANKGKYSGILGLHELEEAINYCKNSGIQVRYYGRRPTLEEIKLAKSGYIDMIIIEVAKENKALLLTSDRVMYHTAKAMDVDVKLIIPSSSDTKLPFEKYFTEDTTSVHIIEGVNIKRKRGHPGNWYLEEISEVLNRQQIEEIIDAILEFAKNDKNSYIEIERKNSIIVQLREYRIVIVKPPVSKHYELTIVKPIKKLKLEDYHLDERIIKRFEEKAEGIVISGPPGSGKTTFVQALAEWYNSKGKIVKTVESPRDLIVKPDITQYSKNFASSQEIHDILLLSRPDYVVFDEMRDTPDFELYKDLRLAGVGMIGVVHAERPIDAIQRFIARTELGMIPQIVDTVIFIYGGEVKKVYAVSLTVKVPTGMSDEDLARPVVEVRDFLTGKLEYELYTFGEEIVVVPVEEEKEYRGSKLERLALSIVEKEVKRMLKIGDVKTDVKNGNVIVYVPSRFVRKLIGRRGKRIEKLERKLGVRISVKPLEDYSMENTQKSEITDYTIRTKGKSLVIKVGKEYSKKNIDIYVNGIKIATLTVNKKGEIEIPLSSEIAQVIMNAIEKGENVQLFA